MCVYGTTRLICLQVWTGVAVIFGLTTFIMLIIHLAHNDHGGPHQQIYCVAYEDSKTYFGGKIEINVKEKQVCVDFLYVNTIFDGMVLVKRVVMPEEDPFCTVESITLKGPVTPFIIPSNSQTLITIVDEPLEDSSDRITYKEDETKCFNVGSDTLKILLDNPSFNFISYDLSGFVNGSYCNEKRHLYLTNLCRDADFSLSQIDDDDEQ